ncbi:unnamed protein product [Brassicogethes aeneus]|uniref:Sushi domain-containing protein n=1 Tax=Brassicogethes aeneus TaxID=1431903 RepID=A0A9P0BEA2_BRAAE|nr:unnamed protein product [Brassicogethes aeneus]
MMNSLYLLLLIYLHNNNADKISINTTKDSEFECPDFYNIDNGTVDVSYQGEQLYAVVSCLNGFDLDGISQIRCINGKWDDTVRPSCIRRCRPPPYITDGALKIEGEKDSNGYYHKNAVATYSCLDGFTLIPSESQYRVCEKGIWTGPIAKCMLKNCPKPVDIKNGYYIVDNDDPNEKRYFIGQRIHYKCHLGYTLLGYSSLQCLQGGNWSPKDPPRCQSRITDFSSKASCHYLPSIEHTQTTVLEGFQSEPWFHGTIIEISCVGRYRNVITPCQPSRLECNDGKWEGSIPKCEVAHECYAPPMVPYAQIINFDFFDSENPPGKFPIKSQITYQCLDSYQLQGNEVLKCEVGGCWAPNRIPECMPYYKCFGKNNLLAKVDGFNAIIWSAITGAGVVVVLLILCCAIMTKKKRPMTRTTTNSPPVLRTQISDHATLLNNPDRLALIAFADGVQSQNEDSLPSYDEAVRRASAHAIPVSMMPGCRLSRPHWPSLANRRARNSPNPDLTSVTRHGSFASHSPSTRSGVDSMGSTDTVAISEGSTNITLDTASSHSGSQPGSCRVHCGSLASFDTSSVVNTEDAPLLEESELEEIQVNLDNISAADNCSFKSADVP